MPVIAGKPISLLDPLQISRLGTNASVSSVAEAITQDGYLLLPEVFSVPECNRLAAELESALAGCADEATALRRTNGALYGARNLLDVFPEARALWRREPLVSLFQQVLGRNFGLVRGLYFDKSPASNWSLPWHQDLAIAVQDNSLPTTSFRNPTRKAGVPHVEAPREILEQMLTVRIHLDDVSPDNGPLRVLAGSHRRDAPPEGDKEAAILANAGDVLVMRPLLYHCSSSASSQSQLHRRIIHLEFTGCQDLPDGYSWRQFFK